MPKQISGADYPLHKIFSAEFDFFIPPYQRPYSWKKDHAEVLFDDLYAFWKTEKDDDYFLGSIVLIKEENRPKSAVVDGQQRLTTLTILLSVLVSKLSSDNRPAFLKFVIEPGDLALSLPEKPRLTLRERDSTFFRSYVQELQLDELMGLQPKNMGNDAQRNIRINTEALLSRFEEKFGTNELELITFGQFLAGKCYLVAVSTPSEKSAFRVFSILNSRGLDLLPTDIIKADTIGGIEPERQEEYTRIWEQMEVENGREGFNNLFSHIRMIYAKEKARRSLREEFQKHVIPNAEDSSTQLINLIIRPYSDAFYLIQNKRYESENDEHDAKINELITWLHRINFSDWIPPALKFLASFGINSEYTIWFFKKLERLASYLHLTGKNINHRIERFSTVLDGLENEHSIDEPIQGLLLSDGEKTEFRTVLNSNVYWLTAVRRNFAVLRLDSFISDAAAEYNYSVLTIEHVLPQSIPDGANQWTTDWPDVSSREQWVHKIANLVPLNRRRNSAAQNFEFQRKKEAYFSGRSNVSSFVLTTQILSEDEWTPEIVSSRQAKLLSIYYDNWELH